MGLVTVLYVFVKVSLFLPQWVEVRAFSILIVFSALSFEVLICSLNVSLGSKVSPSILGLRIVGSRVLSSCSDSSSLYSAGSGVKSVVIVLLNPNRCRPLRGWKTRPEKERRGRPNRHHSIPAPRERGLIQPFFR